MLATVLDSAAQRFWLPLQRRRRGDRSYAHVEEIEAFNRSGPEAIARHHLERLRAVCAAASTRSPFYRKRFQNAGIDDPHRMDLDGFRRLPLLTRDDLRNHGDSIRDESMPAEDLRESATGGTTFAPVRFYMDWPAYYRRRSATIVFDRWFGYEPGLPIAFLWGARQDFPEDTWSNRWRARFVDRTLHLPSLPLDDSVLESYYHSLRRFKPALLQGYPMALDLLSRFLLAQGWKLDIPAVSCTAEPLQPEHIDTIERAFGVRPFNWYSSRDAGRVATECSAHSGMHVNAYGLFIETVPLGGIGERGPESVVVTDLWNTGFPLIRYNTEDLGRLGGGRCDCGSWLPRLTELSGRVGDLFVNSRGQLMPPTALRPGFPDGDRRVDEIQIIQHAPGKFEAVIVPGIGFERSTAAAVIEDTLADLMGEPAEVSVTVVRQIPREPSGKFRSMKRVFDL